MGILPMQFQKSSSFRPKKSQVCSSVLRRVLVYLLVFVGRLSPAKMMVLPPSMVGSSPRTALEGPFIVCRRQYASTPRQELTLMEILPTLEGRYLLLCLLKASMKTLIVAYFLMMTRMKMLMWNLMEVSFPATTMINRSHLQQQVNRRRPMASILKLGKTSTRGPRMPSTTRT